MALLLGGGTATPDEVNHVLDGKLHHLRVGDKREWNDFPLQAESASLTLRFQSRPNPGEWTLRLRQQDVRQTWKVLLNNKELERLPPDENDMVVYVPIPAGWLAAGENTLTIAQVGKVADDVRIGEIFMQERPVREALSEASVEIAVHDGDQAGTSVLLPCRLTVIDARGALMSVGAVSGKDLAVRPGVIYTGTGLAKFGLPGGEYTIYAGRGFAYGIDSTRITLKTGDVVKKSLTLCREVPANGYVSCDTHVHTLTFSGHGDCSLDERMLTLAGENIELPIATDHNRQIDFHAAAVKMGVRRYFTPVVGNEVTTSLGHFNIFPVPAGAKIPDFKAKDWPGIFGSIAGQTGAKAIILNHPRDLHSGYRPLGPSHHNCLTGENLDGWELRANAMEIVNSGAHQSDVMRPVRDWFGLLNRGIFLTPVGASDSHDVARYIVGQGRTYIRSSSADPGKIDVDEAVAHFVQGRVLVSCGLLTEITVAGKYGPGDLVPPAGKGEGDSVEVKVARCWAPTGSKPTRSSCMPTVSRFGKRKSRWGKRLRSNGRENGPCRVPTRRAPDGRRHGAGRAGTVLADQQTISTDLAAGRTPHHRLHRRGLGGCRRRRQTNQRLRIRPAPGEDVGGVGTEAGTRAGGLR